MQDPAMEASSRGPLLVVVIAVLVVLAALVGWWVGRGGSAAKPEPTPEGVETAQPPASEAARTGERLVVPVDPQWQAALDETLSWGRGEPAEASCPAIESQLDALCAESGAPCGLAKSAAIALARRPPTASGELYKHETVLANTFHLFRTLGRRDVVRLRDASRQADVELELHAMAFYRWLASRETCGEGDERALTLSVLNDYAVYGLSTLGGQAYLRRQSPDAEGLATFYALLTVDRAIQAGKDEHGLDPRPFVERAEELLDDEDLALRDEYQSALDGFKTRWGGF